MVKFLLNSIFSTVAILFLVSFSFGQISINSSVDKKEIFIGDSFIYTLTIKCPKEYKFSLPDFKTIVENFHIRNQLVKTKKYLKIYEFELTSYTTGEQKINSFEIEFISPTGEKKLIKQKEISIFVKFLFPDMKNATDIRDIKSQVSLPKGLLWYIIPVLIVSSGLYLFLSQKHKKLILHQQESTSPEKVLSPEEIAYKSLEKLKVSDLLTQGKIKEYYIELSEIVRRYIFAKYKVQVLERTTEELFIDLKKILNIKHNLELKEFLESCDLVKFAKHIPKIQEIQQDFNKAKEIIDTHAKIC